MEKVTIIKDDLGNIISETTEQIDPQQATAMKIRAKLAIALEELQTIINEPAWTNVKIANAVVDLARIMRGIIKLLTADFREDE